MVSRLTSCSGEWLFQDKPKLLEARKWPFMALASSSLNTNKSIKVGILGASGYTGGELTRIIANHPHLKISLMTADRKAGKSLGSVFPHLITQDLPDLIAVKDADFSTVDAVLCCLPHGISQSVVKGLPARLKIVDLSADFRLQNIDDYEEWYSQPHKAPELQKGSVYGLTEIYRDKIQSARLVANPGCYPTTTLLPLVPLIKASLITAQDIIISSYSGINGEGEKQRSKDAYLYTEVSEGILSYGITRHRHVPEIEQELLVAANSKVEVSFTPTLVPKFRGVVSVINMQMAPGVSVEDLKQHLKGFYEVEEFVTVLPSDEDPRTQDVQGSSGCHINVFPDRIAGRAIIISVVGNLLKETSLRALHNLNLMMGIPENAGLNDMP